MTAPSRRRLLALGLAGVAAPSIVRAQSASGMDRAIGRMLILGFSGASPAADSAQGVARQLGQGLVGGVCFLGHNVRTREGVEGLTALFRDAAGGRTPLIAIDQEGGAVQRLGPKLGYPALPNALAVAGSRTPEEAERLYAGMATTLKGTGFTLNLAPVVDLGFEPANPIVAKYGRAFGRDGATVASYAAAFVRGHRRAGVLTALKHFPGHGSTRTDSHERPVDLTPTWRPEELEPYRRLAASGLIDIVMSGHLSHARLTGGEASTLSREAVETVLRRDVGFDGPVMTDDLDMAAIANRYPLIEAIVRAVAAGDDLVLVSNSRKPDPDLAPHAVAAIKRAIEEGRLPRARIEQANARLARLAAP